MMTNREEKKNFKFKTTTIKTVHNDSGLLI